MWTLFFLFPIFLHTVVATDIQRKLWFFQGGSAPIPPQQNISWHVPASDIPNNFTNAVQALFKKGFADPRGCEYRKITIAWGDDAWGFFFRAKTHGWVLPESENSTQRFAILWNGLVYPVIAVGKKVSVKSDVQQIIKYNIQQINITKNKLRLPESKKLQWPEIFLYGMLLSCGCGDASICALLLRLGDVKLAAEVYRTGIEIHGKHYLKRLLSQLEFDYKWNIFSRALAATMYGDDKLALCFAEQLEPLVNNDNTGFGSTSRKLLDDLRRREKEKRQPLPAPKNKIDALIRDLENVNTRQMGQPGSVILGQDKRIKALIAISTPAIEDLLQCLENDQRLTRSVSFGRDFHRQRTIITVADAAYVALSGILQQSFFFTGTTADNVSRRNLESRRKLARKIRKHYNRYKNMKNEEKWYNILKNNDETIEAQLQAAANICRKTNVKTIPNSSGFSVTCTSKSNGNSVGLTGEILRAKTNPSLSELLNTRAISYLPKSESAIATSLAFHNAQRMALLSAKWDLRNSLPTLKQVSAEIYRALPEDESFKSRRLELLIPLTIQCTNAGDKSALVHYCRTLQVNPEAVLGKHCNDAWEKYLEPLYQFPDDKNVKSTAEIIFYTSGNSWSKYFWKFQDARRIKSYYNGLFAQLMRLTSYQKHVLSGLENKNKIIKWQTDITGDRGNFNYEYLDRSGSGSEGFKIDDVKQDPLFPGNHNVQILRVCDVYAKALSLMKDTGYPIFQNYWNEEKRNKVIQKIRAILSNSIKSKQTSD